MIFLQWLTTSIFGQMVRIYFLMRWIRIRIKIELANIEKKKIDKNIVDHVEMPTNNFVESSFWNFDSLFQPQQHPARDAHDTFFIRLIN